jgi:DNA-binding transcriptional regulator/RsmH inhibitor MraZ
LKKDALIIGMVNKIEIWDPKVLAKVDKQNLEIDPAAYDELAKNIII